MKKHLCTLLLLLSGILGFGQVNSENAIGLRFGDNNGFGAEISYQTRFAEMNRVELDLGFRDTSSFNAWKLTGLYQWVWHIDGGFNWYAGFGAGIGAWSSNRDHELHDDGLFINLDGDVGIEYIFEVPFQISLDFRPEFGIVGNFGDGTDFDIALGIRYLF